MRKNVFRPEIILPHILLSAVIFISALGGISCSVNYDNVYDTESTVPELMLDEAVFTRTEDSLISSRIESRRLEEFKDTGKVYAETITFETKNQDGKVNALGRAGVMNADTRNKIYEFYNGIHIEAPERGVKIDGESLKWNANTEQLVGEKGKRLTIEKDGISLSGEGFSASAVSEQFSFSSNIEGAYEDKETDF